VENAENEETKLNLAVEYSAHDRQSFLGQPGRLFCYVVLLLSFLQGQEAFGFCLANAAYP